jgi:hypothetical protein
MSRFNHEEKLNSPSDVADPLTWTLVSCGALAGPLFLGTAIVQGLTRAGFDLAHQPISFLSLGGLGWIQRTNFVLAGLLTVAFAIGIRRLLRGQPGRRLAPLALGGVGLGLIIAGAFAPDPGFGYLPGTPDGAPTHTTYHSTLHGVGFSLSFICFALACFAFARESARQGNRLSVVATTIAVIVALAVALAPGNSTAAVRDLVAAGILWGWIGAQSLRLLSGRRYRAGRRVRGQGRVLPAQTG